jgi:outer membrane lipoprotein SlyB
MPSKSSRRIGWFAVLLTAMAVQAQDLHIKNSISVGGNFVSSSETSIKGARERSVNQGPNGSTITLRQCDLKRTVTLNEQAQTYLVSNDPQDENAARAAALATGAPAAEASGGKITVTTTVTDTGERKVMYGYQARHLKAKVVEEPSPDACNQVRRSFDIDGWFADISKEQAACAQIAPPVQQGAGCHDTVIARRVGSGKPGYPLRETIAMPAPDGSTTTVTIQISELTKQELAPEMFDVPAGYRQVNSFAELNGTAPTTPAQTAQGGMAPAPSPYAQPQGNPQLKMPSPAQMMNPVTGPMAQLAMEKQAMAQAAQLGLASSTLGGMGSGASGAAPVATPQPLGAKAAGKIRIGVAPPEAQVGQGNNAGADYSTPIRNAEVALMNGPAVEVTALDSHIAMQLQAEAQQKQCDYILYSSVAVKHSSSGGFGRFMKMAAPVASMVPMAGMGGGMGGAVAAQAAGAAASAAAMSAQQQAMNQLTGFNGQIKSKDDVTVEYQLVRAGQTSPQLQSSLKGKAKSDGEDVLTPLLQQAAVNVLTEVSKK